MTIGCQCSAAVVGPLKKTTEERRQRQEKGVRKGMRIEKDRKRSSNTIRKEEKLAARRRERKGEEEVGKKTRWIIREEGDAKKASILLREAVSVGMVNTAAWLLVLGCCTAAVLVMLMLLMLTPGTL